MKFVADAMLGRLAKWMRFLGYDVLYFKDIEDSQLVRIARSEGRILLTRDRGIPLRFRIKCILIQSEELQTQLQQVLKEFPLNAESILKRCMECNSLLEKVDKAEVDGLVPEFVRIHRDEFYLCPGCSKVYWEGTHTQNMMESLNEMGIKLY